MGLLKRERERERGSVILVSDTRKRKGEREGGREGCKDERRDEIRVKE